MTYCIHGICTSPGAKIPLVGLKESQGIETEISSNLGTNCQLDRTWPMFRTTIVFDFHSCVDSHNDSKSDSK